MKKIRKVTSILLITVLLCNAFASNVNAKTLVAGNATTVYVDGVQFNVAINDNFEVEVEGHTDISDAYMLIDENGNADLEIENDEEFLDSEDYQLEIDEFSQNDIDIDVYEDGDKVDEISSVEEIIEDAYDGQIAIGITAGGVVISLGMVLEALLAAMLAVIIAGVLYITISKFYAKVQEATSTKREKVKKYYFKAAVWNGQVVVSPKAISKAKAISRVKKNLSVYSFTSGMAKAVIVQAGCYCSKPEIDTKRLKGHVYLYHYHKASSKGHPLHNGGFHSFYGKPIKGNL